MSCMRGWARSQSSTVTEPAAPCDQTCVTLRISKSLFPAKSPAKCGTMLPFVSTHVVTAHSPTISHDDHW